MKSRRKKEWFDNEAFWRELYPFLFTEKRFVDASSQITKALKLAKPPGKTALDLCCGPGRCSVALAKKDFSVVGVDRTKYLLEKARALARAARVRIEWVHRDMRDFVRPDSFAFVLSMFTSFGYFDNKREDLAVLENIYVSLRPGGVFLIDLMGKERLAKLHEPATAVRLPDGSLLVELHEIFDDWTRIRNEWLVIRNGRAKSFKFHHTLYSGQELRDRMERAGFVDVKLYGNLEGDAYGPAAQRLIAVARKPISKRAR